MVPLDKTSGVGFGVPCGVRFPLGGLLGGRKVEVEIGGGVLTVGFEGAIFTEDEGGLLSTGGSGLGMTPSD
jgi:hypothetical protein